MIKLKFVLCTMFLLTMAACSSSQPREEAKESAYAQTERAPSSVGVCDPYETKISSQGVCGLCAVSNGVYRVRVNGVEAKSSFHLNEMKNKFATYVNQGTCGLAASNACENSEAPLKASGRCAVCSVQGGQYYRLRVDGKEIKSSYYANEVSKAFDNMNQQGSCN